MKKLRAMAGSAVALAILTACGSQTANTLVVPQNIENNNNTSIQSAAGLKSFYGVLTEVIFKMIDRNGDKNVVFDEFRSRPNMASGLTGKPVSEIDNSTGVSAPPATGVSAANSSRKPDLNDPLQVFLAIDKNKNGRITVTEAKASKYFLGLNGTQLRDMLVRPMFSKMDANTNKAVSKDEFAKGISAYDANMQRTLLGMFFAADRNADNRLSFSEFEDLLYASFKASWETPAQAPAPTPSDAPAPAPSDAPAPAPSDTPAEPPADTPAEPPADTPAEPPANP